MHISDELIKLANTHNANFISLKYVDDNGFIRQIDSSLDSYQNGMAFIANNSVKLRTIPGKAFLDPFRSQPTITAFCENIASDQNPRQVACEAIAADESERRPKLSARVSFWISEENGEENSANYKFIADPIDQYVNLRSDIILALESVGIKTGVHFHGKNVDQSVIEVAGENLLDLADNIIIARFIIANVADSYAFQVGFAVDGAPNLSILIKGEKDEISKIYDHLKSHIPQISAFAASNLAYSFEIKKVHEHEFDEKKRSLELEIASERSFVPYLGFVELLPCSAKNNALNSKKTKHFHEKG